MNNKTIFAIVAAVAVLLYFAFSGSSPKNADPGSEALPPKAASTAGAGLSGVAAAPVEAPTPEGKAELERLWPHLKNPPPTEADREKVKAQWKALAAKHPDNIYLPNEFRPPLTEVEAKAAKKQLDDVTAVVAQNAAQQRKATGAEGSTPPELTEAQAREKGITPEQQNNFFSYKIKELESRIQLGEFSLTSSEMTSTQKEAMTKELAVWKKELDELVKVKAKIPKS